MIRKAIDNDERAGPPILVVRIECYRGIGGHVAERYIVQRKRRSSQMLLRIHVDFVFDGSDGDRRCLWPDPSQIRSPGDEWLTAHPDYMGGKLVRDFWT